MQKEISKIGNAQILSSNYYVSSHIPEYHPLTKSSLQSMLNKYPTIYVKPNNSCQGKGVIRIERKSNGYLVKPRDRNKTLHKNTIESLMRCIRREKMNRPYLVQQGIASYTKNGRLFDIRTHLLRIHGEWEMGAIIGRVASKRGVATNAYSGGTPVPIRPLLKDHLGLSEEESEGYIAQLTTLSLEATQTFSKEFPKWTEFGLDIGVDEKGHLWIYEINIKPGMLVFRKDQPSYQRIMKMKKMKG
ncbi:YheC/YheD family protein [Shimazuella sp. AN120528]|uniref:YheC/YheD family protein n=1 Tax=Shimazuella soli TaxID=1892854 RepID=UPI001F0E1E23|nr:YheC/YheD family protein [Shimazuella soli]MCH5586496.1 YheC/YheD family protein [Shimazuella soli]